MTITCGAELRGSATIALLAPTDEAHLPLCEALARRRTLREILPTPLPLQTLSNLLWSAFGVNRPAGPFGLTGRTAGSASNSQEIALYVALEHGAYLYEPAAGRLTQVADGDLRAAALTPGQAGVAPTAPVQLIFVVDRDRLTHSAGFQEPGLHDPEVQKSYYFVDTGLIAQNVQLFAAACGLAAWFHNCDRAGLAARLGLGPSQSVLFAQSVGYPAAL